MNDPARAGRYPVEAEPVRATFAKGGAMMANLSLLAAMAAQLVLVSLLLRRR